MTCCCAARKKNQKFVDVDFPIENKQNVSELFHLKMKGGGGLSVVLFVDCHQNQLANHECSHCGKWDAKKKV